VETKGNIRKRRKERLKALSVGNRAVDKQKEQVGGPASKYGQGPLAKQEKAFLQEGGYPLYSRYPLERDPEQVWKEKEEHMFSRSLLGQPLTAANQKDAGQARRPGRTFRLQVLASALIFVLVWGLFQFPHPLTEKARNEIAQAVEREWNFAAISAWYESKFGAAPSFLPTFRFGGQPEASAAAAKQRQATLHTPAQAKVAATFSAKHPWLELQTVVGSPVTAMESGLVTLVSQQEGSGYTVTIRHTGGLESTYGLLTPIRLEQGDWVKSGETIGMAMKSTATGKGTFTFALSQDGTYVNPAEWISFD
jgi:stage IV sporulation protein FA